MNSKQRQAFKTEYYMFRFISLVIIVALIGTALICIK